MKYGNYFIYTNIHLNYFETKNINVYDIKYYYVQETNTLFCKCAFNKFSISILFNKYSEYAIKITVLCGLLN